MIPGDEASSSSSSPVSTTRDVQIDASSSVPNDVQETPPQITKDEKDLTTSTPAGMDNNSPTSESSTESIFCRNIIKSRFSFEIPPKNEPRVITIQEIMSESSLNFIIPQMIMNIFMEDEKLLMNCVTYSLGEVKSEYQRCQMRVLESHLRMVNLMTESLNNIHVYQQQDHNASHKHNRNRSRSNSNQQDNTTDDVKIDLNSTSSSSFFRPSSAKKEPYLQFVPLNFHVQHFTLVRTKGAKRKHSVSIRNDVMIPNVTSPIDNNPMIPTVSLDTVIESKPLDNDNSIDITKSPTHEPNGNNLSLVDDTHEILNSDEKSLEVHTVGSFAAHEMDFDSGGMSRIFKAAVDDVRTPTNNNFSKTPKSNCFRIWKCMRGCFLVNYWSSRMESLLSKFIDQIKETSDTKQLQETYTQIEMTGKILASILDAREVDMSLFNLDSVRQQDLTHSLEMENDNEPEKNDTSGFPGPNQLNLKPKLISRSLSVTVSGYNNRNKHHASHGNNCRNKPSILSEGKVASGPSASDSREPQAFMKRHQSLKVTPSSASNPNSDNYEEIEPVDLIHLNIHAALISISLKLNNANNVRPTIVTIDPSRKKLTSAIKSLKRIANLSYALESVKLDRDQIETFYSLRLRRDMIFCQASSALILAVVNMTNANQHNKQFIQSVILSKTIFSYFESLLSCYGEGVGQLEDLSFAIREVNECLTICLMPNHSGHSNMNKSNPMNELLPRFEGNGHKIRVVIPVAPDLLTGVPLTDDDVLECSVRILIFNIGINEDATVAETLGHVKLQEEINKESFYQLENYVTSNLRVMSPKLMDDLTGLKMELYSDRVKNVRIHHLMQQINYQLNGIRFTSCKSAKDRTSMAVTLEEVKYCFSYLELDEMENCTLFQQMLDTLRRDGTRRENTSKNVGQAKYAFNGLQVMTLPKQYRPPAGTYGNVQT